MRFFRRPHDHLCVVVHAKTGELVHQVGDPTTRLAARMWAQGMSIAVMRGTPRGERPPFRHEAWKLSIPK